MSDKIFPKEWIRKAIDALKAQPAPMQWIVWVDRNGVHKKFYGHRQRLAAKQAKKH